MAPVHDRHAKSEAASAGEDHQRVLSLRRHEGERQQNQEPVASAADAPTLLVHLALADRGAKRNHSLGQASTLAA